MLSKIPIGNILHNDQLLATKLQVPMKPDQIQVLNALQCLNLVLELTAHMLVIHILERMETHIALQQKLAYVT